MTSLPRELAADFPEPVHATAARSRELREQYVEARRAMAPSRVAERQRILGRFPSDMHEGGPVPPMDSPHKGWIVGEYVLPRCTPRDVYEHLMGTVLPKPKPEPEATVVAKGMTCHSPHSGIVGTVEADCPCGRHLNVQIPRWLV